MSTRWRISIAAGWIMLPAIVCAQPVRCAANFADAAVLLGRMQLARAWREVTMDDGKPLTLHITGDSALQLSFTKAEEGLWAAGPVRVCRRASRAWAAISGEQLTLGPAAGWAVRQLLANGVTFELSIRDSGRLQIAAPGWSGDFEAAE